MFSRGLRTVEFHISSHSDFSSIGLDASFNLTPPGGIISEDAGFRATFVPLALPTVTIRNSGFPTQWVFLPVASRNSGFPPVAFRNFSVSHITVRGPVTVTALGWFD